MARYVVHGDGYEGYWLSPVEDGPFMGGRLVVDLSPGEFEDFICVRVAAEAWQERLRGVADDPANVEYGLTSREATALAFEQLPRRSRSE